ncbi:MAG: homoserine O-succinyltransferase [Pseudomonadota bacterium]
MPIKIPDNLPAATVLHSEGVRLIRETNARQQDIRPLRIALLNLMPTKIATETQFSRLLGATPLQVELTLVATGSYEPKNTAAHHLRDFYRRFEHVRGERFDGLIITGAPVEKMPFEDVEYWDELCEIFTWAQTNVFTTLSVCWGAQAALYHRYGIDKYTLPQGKIVGLYRHRVLKANSLTAGLSDTFVVPVSRYTGNDRQIIEKHPDLRLVVDSDVAGPCMLIDKTGHVYIFNHMEYDAETLDQEYRRDCERAARRPDFTVVKPAAYYTQDDQLPDNIWRSSASVIFANWIHNIYQDTPYDLNALTVKPV